MVNNPSIISTHGKLQLFCINSINGAVHWPVHITVGVFTPEHMIELHHFTLDLAS